MVAGLLALRPSPCVITGGTSPATGTGWQTRAAAVSAAYASHGRRINATALDRAGPAHAAVASRADRHGLPRERQHDRAAVEPRADGMAGQSIVRNAGQAQNGAYLESEEATGIIHDVQMQHPKNRDGGDAG